MSFLNLIPVAGAIRNCVKRGTRTKLDNIRLPPPETLAETVIASSEGFTWGFLNQPNLQKYVKALPEESASALARLKISDTVLVMVRDPLDWIRSAHEQTIKQGGWQSAQTFLVEQVRLVRDVLHLENLLAAYSRHFRRVVVLSADELRNTPDVFWSRYEEQLGVARPDPEILDKASRSRSANRSLGSDLIYLARLNRSLQNISQVYGGLRELPAHIANEQANFAPSYDKSIQWIARRIVEHANDAEIERVAETLAPIEHDPFFRFSIDEKMVRHLKQNFIAPLRARSVIGPDTVQAYEARLAMMTADVA